MAEVSDRHTFLRGVSPAVIGALAASMAAILPHAAPDRFALAILVATVIAIVPLPLMVGGGPSASPAELFDSVTGSW